MSSNSDGLAGMPFGGPSASDKLELARRLAQRINLQHNIGKEAKGASQQAAEFILKGGAAMQPTISAKTVAEQVSDVTHTCFIILESVKGFKGELLRVKWYFIYMDNNCILVTI